MKFKEIKLKAQEKINKKKFVITIGDDGAVLTYIINDRLVERLFSKMEENADLDKFRELLKIDNKSPIQILVETSDQTYTQQTLPGTSGFALNTLIQRKLLKDFASIEIKGNIKIGKSQTGKNEWVVILVGCPVTSPLKEWLEFLIKLDNPITGIYLLPIELGNIIKKINQIANNNIKKNFFSKIFDKKKSESKLQLLVTHNKVGGFRQVVFSDEKLIFTRMIAIDQNESTSYIAGNIEQEISNTLEYLKRLAIKNKEDLEVILIVSQDIKNSLKNNVLNVKKVVIYTPYELAIKMNLDSAASDIDKYTDIIVAVNFAQTKPILTFSTRQIKQFQYYSNLITKINLFSKFIIISLILYSCYTFFEIYSTNNIIDNKTLEKNKVTNELDYIKSNSGDLDEISKMNDVINLYNLLIKDNISPLDIIKRFSIVKNEFINIKNINWALREETKANKEIKKTAIAIFDGEFSNNKKGYQTLFDDFDDLIKKLQNGFSNEYVEYTRNTEKISFDDSIKKIPLKITITGPKEDNQKKG